MMVFILSLVFAKIVIKKICDNKKRLVKIEKICYNEKIFVIIMTMIMIMIMTVTLSSIVIEVIRTVFIIIFIL